jgi:hypothetical protein
MLALLLGIALPPVLARAQQPVGRVTWLDGKATITHAGASSPASLNPMDPVLSGDRITLGADSHVKVRLGDKALLTAHPLSELTITEGPNTILTTLNIGKVALDLIEAKLKPGEVHEIRTPLAVVQMRGSLVVVRVLPEVTHIDCVSGEVFVAVEDKPFVRCLSGRGFTIRVGSPP